MKKSIAELKNTLLKGQTVYVLGSGASVNRFRPDFFKDKYVIGVNEVHKKFPVEWCVFTHNKPFQDALGKVKCVVSDVDMAETSRSSNEIDTKEDYWMWGIGQMYDFEGNLGDVGKDDRLCMGNSVSIPAINFAAHLGASVIFLVGFDCCAVNGKIYYDGYINPDLFKTMDSDQSLVAHRLWMNDAFLRNSKEISIMRAKILEVYGADVLTVSPFAGLMCENVPLRDQLSMKEMRVAS